MSNDEIYNLIKENGYKMQYIAQRLNISRCSLHRKLKGESKWSKVELSVLSKILQTEIIVDWKYIQNG